jgi:hypothetical protein
MFKTHHRYEHLASSSVSCQIGGDRRFCETGQESIAEKMVRIRLMRVITGGRRRASMIMISSIQATRTLVHKSHTL